ncbi:FKBP-type peptidyl-prolyl cis-trans isomerase [Actinomycetaceae bacterium MB13-C1-2]|nr:FKBP-type peptidyl-prolyl cis-trans isomerase [Actinomycetaceae bacterium MB13-C1-2]
MSSPQFPTRRSLAEGKKADPKAPVRRQPVEEPPPVTTQIAATGKRSATPTVSVPWWIEYWQPLVLTILMVLVAAGALFAARAYSVSQECPILVQEGILDEVQVSGRHGATPVVELSSPAEVEGVEYRQQHYGDGRTVEENTPVLLSVSAFDGATGESLQPHGLPSLVVGAANDEDLGATMAEIVIGSKEGSRFVVGRVLSNGKVEINVVDVLYTIAKGSSVDAPGPLTVAVSDAGIAITHAAGEAPSNLTTQVLIQGDGPQVHDGDQIVAQYVSVNWTNGAQVASTWDQGAPRLISLDDTYLGLREALVDQRVGTRLAIVIPPDMASGEDTLCVVVDILGAMPAVGTDSRQSE